MIRLFLAPFLVLIILLADSIPAQEVPEELFQPLPRNSPERYFPSHLSSDHAVDHSSDRTFDHPFDHSFDHSSDWTSEHSSDRSFDHPFDRSSDHSVDHSSDHPFDRSSDHSVDHSSDSFDRVRRGGSLKLLRLLSRGEQIPYDSFAAARGKRYGGGKRTWSGLLKMVKLGRGSSPSTLGVAATPRELKEELMDVSPVGRPKVSDYIIFTRGKRDTRNARKISDSVKESEEYPGHWTNYRSK